MIDSVEFFVEPGKYGYHARGSLPCTSWGCHATDPETAAWRAALKHWFPTRPNNVLLYREVRFVTMVQLDEQHWRANLELSDADARTIEFSQAFTPRLPLFIPTEATRSTSSNLGTVTMATTSRFDARKQARADSPGKLNRKPKPAKTPDRKTSKPARTGKAIK